jgi:hypothetical protein
MSGQLFGHALVTTSVDVVGHCRQGAYNYPHRTLFYAPLKWGCNFSASSFVFAANLIVNTTDKFHVMRSGLPLNSAWKCENWFCPWLSVANCHFPVTPAEFQTRPTTNCSLTNAYLPADARTRGEIVGENIECVHVEGGKKIRKINKFKKKEKKCRGAEGRQRQ